MLKSYFQVAVRSLQKNLIYSAINIIGLSVGLTTAILILIWINHETSYDEHIPKRDRLYQVWMKADYDGKINTWNSVPLPSYMALKEENVHIKNTTVVGWGSEHLLQIGDKKLNKTGYAASKEFLKMFEFELLSGDRESLMDKPKSIVLTRDAAADLFGEEDPVGREIIIDEGDELTVTGVLENPPTNSSWEFEYLLTWEYQASTAEWIRNSVDNWGNYSFQVFVELDHASNMKEVETAVTLLPQENGEKEMNQRFFLYPMERWHLYSSFEDGKEDGGGIILRVRLFGIIALFILIIACINFMNLATARSEKRSKEVGIRKTVGSRRVDLIFQFLSESILITLISFVLAIILAQLILPLYNNLLQKELFIDYGNPNFWLAGLLICLVTGCLAGSYPALYLSSFSPVKVLKSNSKSGTGGSRPRKVLVTIQFVISIIMIIGTLVVLQQIKLVKSRELGYDQERLLAVSNNSSLTKNYEVLKNELINSGAVEAITRSNNGATNVNSNNFIGWPGKPEDLKVLFSTVAGDYDYTKTLGIKILEGRDFSRDYNDSASIIINKSAADLMNLENPIGTELDLWGSKYTIIGIMENVLMGSVYREIKPLFMIFNPSWGGWVNIRVAKGDLEENLATIKRIYEARVDPYPFDYEFVDEVFKKKFRTISQTSDLAKVFAIIIIIITGLGLLGLASYTAEQRLKEIGIRKVMGASVKSILFMINLDFMRLILISVILACPLGYYLMDRYLEQYQVRISIPLWIFVVTVVSVIIFAITVISGQALRAARMNPVKSIRSNS